MVARPLLAPVGGERVATLEGGRVRSGLAARGGGGDGAIMRRRWPELELGLADAVWRAGQGTFSAQIAGPHFEGICRSYATLHGAEVFGELPAGVGSGTINDAAGKSQLEVDVVALAFPVPNEPRRILSLGEAKWGEVMGMGHLRLLERAAALLAPKYDTREEDAGGAVRCAVEVLYAGVGLDLATDLARINAAPRIAADPAGVDYARESTCGDRFAKPLLYLTTTGDPLSPVSNSRPLETAALAAGAGEQVRLL